MSDMKKTLEKARRRDAAASARAAKAAEQKQTAAAEQTAAEAAKAQRENDSRAALLEIAAGLYQRIHLETRASPAECLLGLRHALGLLDSAILGTAALHVASRACGNSRGNGQ